MHNASGRTAWNSDSKSTAESLCSYCLLLEEKYEDLQKQETGRVMVQHSAEKGLPLTFLHWKALFVRLTSPCVCPMAWASLACHKKECHRSLLWRRFPVHERPNLVLSAEEELGITAGLQDRVVQVFGGVVFMDFEQGHMQAQGHGRCRPHVPSLTN